MIRERPTKKEKKLTKRENVFDKKIKGKGFQLTQIRNMSLLLPVLKVDAHGAHVRGTKKSWGDQKAG